jgi:putative DNA primase/helicase
MAATVPFPAKAKTRKGGSPADRLPPANEQAEKGLIGAVLYDPARLGEVLDLVEADDFWRAEHQRIWHRVASLARSGVAVDTISLGNALDQAGELDQIGGVEYLGECCQSVPNALNTLTYAEIVRDKAIKRRLIEQGQRALEVGYDDSRAAADLAQEVADGLAELALAAGQRRGSELVLTRLADVEARDVEWLQPGVILRNKVNLLAGEAKLGKSFYTMDLSARVSSGGEIPFGGGECFDRGSVLLLCGEDDVDDTIKPRLVAAGGDPSRVHAIDAVRLSGGQTRAFDLSMVPALRRTVEQLGDVKLLVIDPVTQYVGARVDDNKAVQLRATIGPLRSLARECNVAVLLVTHLNKGSSPKAMTRVMGSGAYTQLARANWYFCRDPKDPKRRLMLDMGTNLREESTGFSFRIVDNRVVWEDIVTESADEHLAAQEEARGAAGTTAVDENKAEQAKAWLLQRIAPGQFVPSDTILKQGEQAGFNRNVMFAGKSLAGIRATKRGFNSAWHWTVDPVQEAERNVDEFV